jgi:hypothetical protein
MAAMITKRPKTANSVRNKITINGTVTAPSCLTSITGGISIKNDAGGGGGRVWVWEVVDIFKKPTEVGTFKLKI